MGLHQARQRPKRRAIEPQRRGRGNGRRTPAAPRFSMVGIRWPAHVGNVPAINSALRSNSVVSALFKRTSKIQLALLEWVEIGQGVPDEVGGEPHRWLPGVFRFLGVFGSGGGRGLARVDGVGLGTVVGSIAGVVLRVGGSRGGRGDKAENAKQRCGYGTRA